MLKRFSSRLTLADVAFAKPQRRSLAQMAAARRVDVRSLQHVEDMPVHTALPPFGLR